MRLGRRTLLVAALILAAAVPALAARTAFRYDPAQRIVNACVLGVGGQTVAAHPNPYLIEGIRRSDLTPDDWVFENPLAPPAVVAGEATTEYVVKGQADYWFVTLTDQTGSRLVGMDLIYICAATLDLTQNEQDSLKAAVDAGAVLWIDEAPAGTAVASFPWAFTFSNLGTGTMWARVARDPHHDLLSSPLNISAAGVGRLGDVPDWDDPDPQAAIDDRCIVGLDGIFRRIVDVVEINTTTGELTTTSAPFVVAGDYGSGGIIVTTGDIGRDVVEWIIQAQAGQTGFTTAGRRPTPNPLQAPDVRLALNMVQWGDRWQQARGAARASASSVARAPFPLHIEWQYPHHDDADTIGAVVSTPVYGRDMVYALSLPSTDGTAAAGLMCFDMVPEEDRDGDTWPDDGIADYGAGASYDMIWNVDLRLDHSGTPAMTPRFSSPTLTSWLNPGGNLSDPADDVIYPHALLVSYVDADGGTGWVDCYDASATENGTRLWRRQITGYSATSQVVALSTPVVHNGFVYVLASEYDAAAGAGIEGTYGRVHCFELDYAWDDATPEPADAAWWVYPSSAANLDAKGSDLLAGVREHQRSLPVFHEPAWVATPAAARTALPPTPGAIPVVYSAAGTADGSQVDAVVTFGTPVTHMYNEASGQVVIDPSVGGSQFALVPTPLRVTDSAPERPGLDSAERPFGVALNHDYHLVRTNDTKGMTAYTRTLLEIDTGESVPGEIYIADVRHLAYAPGAVREAIAVANAAGADPMESQLGVPVLVDYTGDDLGPVTEKPHTLQGPVLWRRTLPLGQQIVQPTGMAASEIAVGSSLSPTGGLPPRGGAVNKVDAATGAVRWSYDPVTSMPTSSGGAVTASVTGSAVAGDTVIVGATGIAPPEDLVANSIIGLRRQVDASVLLSVADEPAAVELLRAGGADEIAPTSYRVDPATRRLTFPSAGGANLLSTTGASLGPIYGRAIMVTWPNGALEMHAVPDIERFHHTAGFIRLQRHPVDLSASLVIRRPNGLLVNGWAVANPTTVGGVAMSLDGWISIAAAQDATGTAIEPGDELQVSYRGWSERDGGFIDIPNANLNIAAERHEAPQQFGASLSSPVVAGNTIHLGTQGLDADLNNVFDIPAGTDRRITDSMLSLIWNRSTGLVRSGLTTPAIPQGGLTDVPVVMGSPSVADDRVFVGSRMMATPAETDISLGYVSALKPWRVLLCDTDRIVETTGSDPSWVCTGTAAPQRAQSFVGEDVRRPFSRPAKATRLQTGNILVVDSGNNRVVEIDRAGRVIWPLDTFGYEYYTSTDNTNLSLSRPADAHRYYTNVRVDTNGDDTPDSDFPAVRTIIADSGNARVLEITTTFYDRTTFVQDGRQRHEIRTVTPAYVQVGAAPRRFVRVRYTSAIPLRDPGNSVLVGYLCAASNLNQLLVVTAENRIVNPPANITMAGGSGGTWQHFAWLYDEDPAADPHVTNQPLQFENIKHVDYRRIGDTIYVSVTASRYTGRAGADTPHRLAAAGAGVFEFRINVGGTPDTWRLEDYGGAPWPTDDPHWYFTRASYYAAAPAMTTVVTEADDFTKPWYPVCAQRISDDRVLMVNSLTEIESATYQNLMVTGAEAGRGVLGSHIFEVVTQSGAADNIDDDFHSIPNERSVPAPGESWADPFTQPAYAEVR